MPVFCPHWAGDWTINRVCALISTYLVAAEQREAAIDKALDHLQSLKRAVLFDGPAKPEARAKIRKLRRLAALEMGSQTVHEAVVPLIIMTGRRAPGSAGILERAEGAARRYARHHVRSNASGEERAPFKAVYSKSGTSSTRRGALAECAGKDQKIAEPDRTVSVQVVTCFVSGIALTLPECGAASGRAMRRWFASTIQTHPRT